MAPSTVLRRALRAGGVSTGLIKGEASSTPDQGLVPGFSASGQDVWLPRATHFGPGLVLSAVGARCGKVFEADGAWSVVANTVVLTPQPGNHPRFLWYLVNNEDFWEKGGTAQPYVRVPETLARRVWLPSLTEQRAIADYLDTETARIDALIDKKQRLVQVLDERFAVASDAIIWGSSPTAPLRHFVSGITVGIVVQPASYYVEPGTAGAVPAVRAIDTKPYAIQTTDLVWISSEGNAVHRKSQLRAGDVVVVRTGNAGAACVVPTELEGANCISNVIVRCSARLDSAFIEAVLNSARARTIISAESVGAIQQHFGVDAARQFQIPDLSIEEQRSRVAVLTALRINLEKTSACITRQIELLREHRQALITAAVSGEFEITGVAA